MGILAWAGEIEVPTVVWGCVQIWDLGLKVRVWALGRGLAPGGREVSPHG